MPVPDTQSGTTADTEDEDDDESGQTYMGGFLMGSVAITGAGGYIGQRLIAYLDSQDTCDDIFADDMDEQTIGATKGS